MANDGTPSPAPTTSIEDEIAAHNARIDEGPADETIVDEPIVDDHPVIDPDAGKESPAVEKVEEPAKEDAPAGEQPAGEALVPAGEETVAGTYVFTPELPIEKFQEQKAAYLNEYAVTPEIEQMFEYLEQQRFSLSEQLASVSGGEAAAAPAKEAVFEPYGGEARVSKVMKAFDRLAEVDIEGRVGSEVPVPNAKPVIEFLKTTHSQPQVSAIASELLMSDSMKYRGHSVFDEVVMDIFHVGPQKMVDIYNYLIHNQPLPEIGRADSLPAGIDETLKDAYWAQPERKRFVLESMAKEIAQIESDLLGMDPFYKAEASDKLIDLKASFADEMQTLVQIQKGIDATKTQEQITQRQQYDAAAVFSRELQTEYLTEVFGMSESFIAVIAPQLTFLDEGKRVSFARNIVARVAAALSFLYDDSFAYVADPSADVYAAQFKEEGISFDFAKGRELLHKHLLACRKIKVLKQTNSGEAAIELATRDKNAVMKEIKAGQAEITGQITALYVKSAGTALKDKVNEAAGKKQAVRRIVNTPGGVAPSKDSPEKVERDRQALNARIDRELAEGDDLADIVFDRKSTAAK